MKENSGDMGQSVSFNAGDIIYEQDSETTGVYLLLEGQVDIWRSEGEQAYHIASISGGELLGEVSVIENRPHSVTAKVSRPTSALFIDADAFRKSFSDPLVRHVVYTLASRLRSSYAVAQALEDTDQSSLPLKSEHPIIEGASRMVASKFLSFVEITKFPYLIGNISTNAKHAVTNSMSLRVPLVGVPELSENHFEVIRRSGELYVRDLGGPHGTLVNGTALSKYGMNATARLRQGKNEIVAGGVESPVRFSIVVPPKAQE